LLLRTVTSPLTMTVSMPAGYWCGFSYVAVSATVFGSKMTTSPKKPSWRAAVRDLHLRCGEARHAIARAT
jgi:hypothetical protein